MSTETKPKNESRKIPFVDYLVLDDPPYLQAQECTNCGARYFDRRNACANCFKDKFTPVAIATEGEVTRFQYRPNGSCTLYIRSSRLRWDKRQVHNYQC